MKYRSKFEKTFAVKYPHLPYESEQLPYWSAHTYTPDFVTPSGKYWLELKGRFRTAAEAAKYIDIRKHLHFHDKDKPPELIFVFMDPKKKMPGARKRKDGSYFTMDDWAKKNKFKYCTMETIKQEWLR